MSQLEPSQNKNVQKVKNFLLEYQQSLCTEMEKLEFLFKKINLLFSFAFKIINVQTN